MVAETDKVVRVEAMAAALVINPLLAISREVPIMVNRILKGMLIKGRIHRTRQTRGVPGRPTGLRDP
jgi:hypothetical protein